MMPTGHSVSDIADACGCKPGSIHQILCSGNSKAIRRLAKKLNCSLFQSMLYYAQFIGVSPDVLYRQIDKRLADDLRICMTGKDIGEVIDGEV